ncbi:MAG: iron-sulfur cluster repair di-iron protein [Candidatus Obscuribacterales bacterium]
MNPKKHACTLCDYIYDDKKGDSALGIAQGTPFEQLSDDFKHPDCSGNKEMFETCTCVQVESSREPAARDLSRKALALGDLVAQEPLRARVFDEFGLDFCCGGRQSLEEACLRREIDINTVLKRLAGIENPGSPENWTDLSVRDFIDHIEGTHHAYLKTELPRLYKLSEKVARVHGKKAPEMIELLKVFRSLKEEIEQHTLKEEKVLFPYIRDLESQKLRRSAPFGTVANPIRCMEYEHEDAGEALIKIRDLTGGYVAPLDACGSWKALVGGLKAFDQDLRIHIHKENSILFPKALLLEKKVMSA